MKVNILYFSITLRYGILFKEYRNSRFYFEILNLIIKSIIYWIMNLLVSY